jgi:hypothetical protein
MPDMEGPLGGDRDFELVVGEGSERAVRLGVPMLLATGAVDSLDHARASSKAASGPL